MLSNYPVTGEYQPAGDYITPSDTADMLSNYQLKGEIGTISDTVVIPYTLPWAFTDSAGMKAGRDYAPFIWAGTTDTIGMDSVCVMSITAGTPNFTFQMYVNDTLNTTATTAVAVFTSAQTVGAASKVKGQWFIPNNRTYILPNEKIWIRFIGRTTVPEYGATLQINGTVY